MDVIAKFENITKTFGKKTALSDVSLDIHPGEIIGLLGPNGSGKTTLIKILNSLIAEYDGKITVDGQPIGVYSKSVISYLPDEPYFEKWQKGTDVIDIFIDMYKDFDYDRCISLLNRFKIDPAQRFRSMSKGMKEKFLLSLVMSRKATIIVLDEPIGGVDPAAREIILDTILENYDENQTIIMSTHLIADIERIFNRVVFLKDGAVVLDEDVESVRMRTGKSIDELFREEFR